MAKAKRKASKAPKPAPGEILKEPEAARFLTLSVRTLQAWRIQNYGPPFIKVGRSVRYRHSDLVAWLDKTRVQANGPPPKRQKPPELEPSLRDSLGLTAADSGDVAGVGRFLRWLATELVGLSIGSPLPASVSNRLLSLQRDATHVVMFADGYMTALADQKRGG